jgi:hypothetical protein
MGKYNFRNPNLAKFLTRITINARVITGQHDRHLNRFASMPKTWDFI